MRDVVYGFNAKDAATLKGVASAWKNTPRNLTGAGGVATQGFAAVYVVELTTTLTAATFSTNITPGSGTGKLKKLGATYLEDRVPSSGSGTITRTVKSLFGHAVPSGELLFVSRSPEGTFWAVSWLNMPSLLCRFDAGAAFDSTDSSVSGTIQSYIGFGANHASTSATFNNLADNTDSAYIFEGDSGDSGLAFYTGSGTTWQIIQMECPAA